MKLTAAKVRKICPGAHQDLVDAIVDNWTSAENAGINTPRRAAHFLATIATETGGLKAIEENLSYTEFMDNMEMLVRKTAREQRVAFIAHLKAK